MGVGVGGHPPSQLQNRPCLAEVPAWASLSSSRSNWEERGSAGGSPGLVSKVFSLASFFSLTCLGKSPAW